MRLSWHELGGTAWAAPPVTTIPPRARPPTTAARARIRRTTMGHMVGAGAAARLQRRCSRMRDRSALSYQDGRADRGIAGHPGREAVPLEHRRHRRQLILADLHR